MLGELLLVLACLGTPFGLGAAWWRWRRAVAAAPPTWRATALIVALVVCSANALVFYGWLLYRLTAGPTQSVLHLKQMLAGDVTYFVIGVGLFATALGKGEGRVLVGVCLLLATIMWASYGI
jgi:hypothetical protein